MKISRNQRCPCGSGKKYKRCHGLPEKDGTAFAVELVPLDEWRPGKILIVPKSIEFRSDDEVAKKTTELEESLAKSEFIKKADGLAKSVAQSLAAFCRIPKTFEIRITETEHFKPVDENSGRLHCCCYWNEIDQRIHYYRVEFFRLFGDQLENAILNLDDHLTLTCLARRILELAINYIANHWVVVESLNSFAKNLLAKNDLRHFPVWENLEKFAIGLICWSPKNRKDFDQFFEVDRDWTAELTDVNYQPMFARQFKIAEYYLKHRHKGDEQGQIQRSIERLNKNYKRLCKFVHPSPHLLRRPDSDGMPNDLVKTFAQSVALETIIESCSLLEVIHEEEPLPLNFFGVLINHFLNTKKKQSSRLEIQDEFIKRVLNNFKDLVFENDAGEIVEIHKHQRSK